MRAVMLMFDSLNRHLLQPYGCDWTHTPNFKRLAERTVTFNRAYCCSMPCMPARRELHTGRPNFLHSNWSPMDPYDDSMPELLSKAGIQTHLASDHYHYWEEPAANYHTKFDTWEFFRGQEGDPFVGQVDEPYIPEHQNKKGRRQDWVNREHMQREEDWPLPQTMKAGLSYIDRNKTADNWFIQIECFDPHEPWYVPRKYQDIFAKHFQNYSGPLFDWPGYCPVDESPQAVEHARFCYAALLAMCDAYLGEVLDMFDKHDLWKDTLLIVNTDHGFLLGEHNWWAKNSPPWYEELSHLPLFVHDPAHPELAGQRRDSFVQTIDLAPTILDYFGQPIPKDMAGISIRSIIERDEGGRGVGMFGGFGHMVNVTDGKYVYMRAPVNENGQPLNEYNLSVCRARQALANGNDPGIKPHEGFSFTKGMPVWQVPVPPGRGSTAYKQGHLLFDLETDPQQQQPLSDPEIEKRMIKLMVEQMQKLETPAEQYERLGLTEFM